VTPMVQGLLDHSLLEAVFNSWDAGWRGEWCSSAAVLLSAPGSTSPLNNPRTFDPKAHP